MFQDVHFWFQATRHEKVSDPIKIRIRDGRTQVLGPKDFVGLVFESVIIHRLRLPQFNLRIYSLYDMHDGYVANQLRCITKQAGGRAVVITSRDSHRLAK